jgi:putative methyltransferase (TIGR04325 family)
VKESDLAKVRRWVPPIAWDALRSRVGTRWHGDYRSWEEAARACGGYDAPAILERVAAATRAVVRGEAACERDSMIFDRIQYSWPVLAALLWIASRREGRLNVVDFGGSLGSTYRQNAKFLTALREVRWTIVEQDNFVELGRREFETEVLRFHSDLEACLAETKPDVVFFSGVLQCIENPYAVLDVVTRHGVPFLVMDRTPFIQASEDRLTVQTVSKRVYEASYPAWFFSRQKFMAALAGRYRLVEEFEAIDRAVTVPSQYLGFVFERL